MPTRTLVFLLDGLGDVVFDQLGDVVDVSAALGRGDRVDEGHLLEAVVGDCDRDLPTIACLLVHRLHLLPGRVLVAFNSFKISLTKILYYKMNSDSE